MIVTSSIKSGTVSQPHRLWLCRLVASRCEDLEMRRRDLLLSTGLGAAGILAGLPSSSQLLANLSQKRIIWNRSSQTQLFSSATCDGKPLRATQSPGLLDATCGLGGKRSDTALKLDSNSGLHTLPSQERRKMIRDIESIL